MVKKKAHSQNVQHLPSIRWPYAMGLCAVLIGCGMRIWHEWTDSDTQNLSARQSLCWSTFDKTRQALEDASVIEGEDLLMWAQRHGVRFPTSGVELIVGGIGGLRLGKLKSNQSLNFESVISIPASLGLFLQPRTNAWDFKCIEFTDSHESMIMELVLVLLNEKRRGAISPWAPWLQSLPELKAFKLHPLMSPIEELQRFEGLELADYMQEYQKDVRKSYEAILTRPVECLTEIAPFQSYEEYLWARLITETRAVRSSVCGHEVLTFLPVFDSINTGKAGSDNVRLASGFSMPGTPPSFSIHLEEKLSAGDELVIHYKDASNDQLAGTWGFVLEDNPIHTDILKPDLCSQLREVECVVPGCLFAPLRNEACDWLPKS